MVDFSKKHVLAVLLLALLAVTAGCAGGGSDETPDNETPESAANGDDAADNGESDDTADDESADDDSTDEGADDMPPDDDTDESDETNDGTDDETDDSDSTDDPMDDETDEADDSDDGQTPAFTEARSSVGRYVFTEGESYTYANPEDPESGTLTWTAVAVSEPPEREAQALPGDPDEVVVNITGTGDGQSGNITLEGFQGQNFSTIFQKAADNFAAATFFSLRNAVVITDPLSEFERRGRSPDISSGRRLAVGNSWVITEDDLATGAPNVNWDRATVDVIRNDSYAGIDCAVIEVTPQVDDPASRQFCVNRDYPFALSASSDAENSLIENVALVETSR